MTTTLYCFGRDTKTAVRHITKMVWVSTRPHVVGSSESIEWPVQVLVPMQSALQSLLSGQSRYSSPCSQLFRVYWVASPGTRPHAVSSSESIEWPVQVLVPMQSALQSLLSGQSRYSSPCSQLFRVYWVASPGTRPHAVSSSESIEWPVQVFWIKLLVDAEEIMRREKKTTSRFFPPAKTPEARSRAPLTVPSLIFNGLLKERLKT